MSLCAYFYRKGYANAPSLYQLPGASFGLHRHGDDNEFYVVLEGNGRYTAEVETVPVAAGDIIMNEPYAAHCIANTGGNDMRLLVFEVYNR